MPAHDGPNDAPPSEETNEVDVFLAQPAFIETPGVDEAALEREKLLHPGPDAESIVEAIELLIEHHQTD